MSDLNSFTQSLSSSQQNYKSLTQLVNASVHLLKGSDTQKYMDLGTMYLTTLVTQVVYFQIKAEPKAVKKFLSTKFIDSIAQRTMEQPNSKQLLVGMGMLCLSNSSKAIDSVISQLSDIITLEMADLAYEDKNQEKSLFDIDMNKKLNALHVSTDVESDNMNQNSFTKFQFDNEQHMISKITFNLNYSAVLDNEANLNKQINQYIGDNRDYASMFNHLVSFKPNTFKIIQDTYQQHGGLFLSTLKISFVHFLNENQLKQYTAIEQGTSKKIARSKSFKTIIRQIFNAFPYVFKDFKYCMGCKNTKF